MCARVSVQVTRYVIAACSPCSGVHLRVCICSQVISVSVNYGILYSYFTVWLEGHVEKEGNNSTFRLKRGKRQSDFVCLNYYKWAPAPPASCSVTCGNGTRTTRYQCVYIRSQATNVPDRFCRCHVRPAPINEVCEKPACASR